MAQVHKTNTCFALLKVVNTGMF